MKKTKVTEQTEQTEITEEMELNKKTQQKKKLRKILYPALIVLVFIGCSVGYYFFSLSTNYFSTDNAKVTAEMYVINPTTPGKLIEWNVEEGDLVEKDQILGRTEALPYITSPIDGTVIRSKVIQDQQVTAATELAVIADTSKMYINVNIEETEISKIRLGEQVEVKIDAYDGKTFSGTVTEIKSTTQTFFTNTTSLSTSGTYSKVTQLIPVRVEIENKENLPMTFGMNATVKIHLN